MSTLAQIVSEAEPGGGARASPAATPTRELEHRLIIPVLGKTEIVRLPGLPILIDRALKASRESSDARAVAEWVALDPTLAARLLQATAVPSQAREAIEFRSLEARAAALGPELLRSLLVHAARSALGPERLSLTARELAGFWMHSLRCALLSRALAERCGGRRPEEAYLAGLLHDFGSLALLTAVPNTFRSLVADQASTDGLGIPEHAGRLGTIHAQIGAALLQGLQLPFYAADAVLLHHAPRAELEGTHLLVRILRCAETLSHPRVPVEQLRAVGELLGMSAADISGAEKVAAEAMSSVLRKLGLARPETSGASGSKPAPVVDMQRLSDTLVMRFVEEAQALRPGAPSGAPEPEHAAAEGGEPDLAAPGWGDALPSARGTMASLFGHLANEAARLEAMAALHSVTDLQSAVSAILPLSGIVTGLQRAVLFAAGGGAGDWPGWVVDAQGATRLDLQLSTGVSRSLVAQAAREARPVSSCTEGTTTRLAGMDLQIARILGAEAVAALPLLGKQPGSRGVVVFGTSAPRAAGLDEHLPFLEDVARLAAASLAAGEARAAAAGAGEPAEQLRSATKRLVHEARNPLSVLKTYLEIARTRAGNGEGLAKELEIASQEVERVAKLLDAISHAGEQEPERTCASDINGMIRDLLLVYGDALFGSKGIALSTLLDERLAPIACDAEGLKQVLLNLLKNASEAVPSGGQVLVGTSDRVNYEGSMMVEISVADDGPGIAPERMGAIFAAPAGAARPDGRGLGLTTSLAIVKAMNGHLVCRSRPASGTTFSILLPRGADAGAEPSPAPAQDGTGASPPSRLDFAG